MEFQDRDRGDRDRGDRDRDRDRRRPRDDVSTSFLLSGRLHTLDQSTRGDSCFRWGSLERQFGSMRSDDAII